MSQRKNSFSSVPMQAPQKSQEFGFGKFFEEQARSQPFYEKPIPKFDAIISSVGKSNESSIGVSGQSVPAVAAPLGDSEALQGWRNVSVVLPM